MFHARGAVAVLAPAAGAWCRVVVAVGLGSPVPTIGSILVCCDGCRRERLPANLTTTERDDFGAHTYERVDRPRGQFFYNGGADEGGDVTARTYPA